MQVLCRCDVVRGGLMLGESFDKSIGVRCPRWTAAATARRLRGDEPGEPRDQLKASFV
jgi:hypothetical protein